MVNSLGGNYKNNTYWCDLCAGKGNIDKGLWHCAKNCNYDVCAKCELEFPTKCDKGHYLNYMKPLDKR